MIYKHGIHSILFLKWWIFIDASGFVRHWHISSGQCLWTTDEKRHTLAVAISPLALNFSTAGSDNKVFLYDLVTHKKISSFESRYIALQSLKNTCITLNFFSFSVILPLLWMAMLVVCFLYVIILLIQMFFCLPDGMTLYRYCNCMIYNKQCTLHAVFVLIQHKLKQY